MSLDVSLLGSVALLTTTMVFAVLYYRRIKKVTKEYAEARDVVGDVVVSFNKQLQRQEEGLETKLNAVTSKITETSENEKKLHSDVENLKGTMSTLMKTQEEIKKHVEETPETNIEAVIPIKRERALAPLTQTELHVLELVAEGDEKTAPQIKELIKLTREHTARLVKKLYEEGYLERNTDKTPYTYRVKEEMLKILRKTESKTQT